MDKILANYLTVKELRELVEDMPDNGYIYFNLDKKDDEMCWLDDVLVRNAEKYSDRVILVGEKLTKDENTQLLKADIESQGLTFDE